MGSLFVVSDVHGYVADLRESLRSAGLVDADDAWTGGDAQLWVLGDLLDRGPDGVGAIDLVRSLMDQRPDQVHMLMGNHEVSQWGNRLVMKEDRDLNTAFKEGVIEAYGPEKGPEIYNTYLRLFGTLPLGLRTPNRIFISHSLPREKYVDRFELRHLETDAFPPEDLTVDFVCIPRPIERSDSADGGPIAYRVSHHVRLWGAGETPKVVRASQQGVLPLVL